MSDEDRFIDIETKIAYQDDLLQTLNDAMIEQREKIAVLEQRCQALLERMAALHSVAVTDADSDERPPHY